MAKLYKLSNGLEVLLEENHAAPVISFHVLVKVGSSLETSDEAGICHLIEHMLFKGTTSRKVGEIAKDVESAGGEINAYTSLDQTVFYINMASRFAKRGLSILADAVQHPLFDEDELEREKEVVLEEIRRERDNPPRRTGELLFSKAFKRHPYGRPIIGYEKTVKSFTREKILGFYRKWYTPNNMTLIAVGEFNSGSMLKEIKKEFGRFKGKRPPRPKLPSENRQRTLNIHLEKDPINTVYFTMGFHIPSIVHEDIPALDVLSHILAGSDSSRLQQEIREKKELVNSVYSYAFSPKEPGLFLIGGFTTSNKIGKAISSICKEVRKLYSEPVKTGELSLAKLNIRSNEIYEKETTSGQAEKYAYFMATAGTHKFEEDYYRALKDVQADAIMMAAQKYLVPKNLTLIIVAPKESASDIKPSDIKRHINKELTKKAAINKAKQQVSPPEMKRLSNGIRLVIRENHTLPIVACSSASYGGLRFETRSNNGINALLSRIITKGTKDKSAVEIAKSIESIAGMIEGYSGRNTFGIRTEFLSDKFSDGFGLFAEVLTEPSFPASEIAMEKRQLLDAIKNQEDALTSLAFMKFLSALFPRHPYGLRTLGERKSVNKLNRGRLVNYYRKIITPNNMVISVVGDVSPDEVVRVAEESLHFKDKKTTRLPKPSPERPGNKPVRVEYSRPEKEQAHIVIGFLGPRMASKDRYTIAVLNNILSGQGGRLFLNLRDKMSLAYAVNSTYFAGIEPGYIALYIATEPSKIEKAINGMTEEMKSILSNGITTEELRRAKNHIIGTYELERQQSLGLASSYACNVLYGLGMDEVDKYPSNIEKVTRADISTAVKKFIRLDAPVISVIKPE